MNNTPKPNVAVTVPEPGIEEYEIIASLTNSGGQLVRHHESYVYFLVHEGEDLDDGEELSGFEAAVLLHQNDADVDDVIDALTVGSGELTAWDLEYLQGDEEARAAAIYAGLIEDEEGEKDSEL